MDVSAVDPPRPQEPPPEIGQPANAAETPSALAISVVVLAVLATLYTMYFAREFFVPIVFAVLLNFLLSPVIRVLHRIKIPPPAAAGLVVLLLVGGVAGGVYALAGPAQTLANSAPETLGRANTKLRALFLARFQKATSQVERAASTLGDPVTGRPPRQLVVSTTPTIGSRILGTTQILVAGVIEIAVLLYFLLAGGDLFLQKFIKMLPTLRDKRRAVNVARAIETAVSAYLSTALFVNLAEGVVVGLCLWALGMPTPALWGAMIVMVEFIPYLGALTGVVVLALAGLANFDSVGHALLIPGSYLAINLIQANLVTPMLLGHRLTLNPVAIFVGLTFFFWIWGVAGAFLAVPLLATLKIVCDHIGPLAALGEFLGERDHRVSARDRQPKAEAI
jgi:predicted PurR-regulated permease PerM